MFDKGFSGGGKISAMDNFLGSSGMRKTTKLVQALIGAGLIVGMNSVQARLWHDAEMTNALVPDENRHYVTNGNAWLNGHTYFSQDNSVVTIGGNLDKTGEEGKAKLQLSETTIVQVANDVTLDTLSNVGKMEIGGTLTVDVLEQHGMLTGIDDSPLGKVVVGALYNHVDGIYNDLTVTKSLNNNGSNLTMTGSVGSNETSVGITNTNGQLIVNGDVYTNRVAMTNGNVTINGSLELNGGWFMVTGDGDDVLQAKDVVIRGSGTVYGSEIKVDTLTIDGVGAEKARLFTVAYENQDALTNLGKLSVKTLVLDGNVNFQHHDKKNSLEIEKVVLNTTSQNYFQTYGGMKLGMLEVGGDARIDGYAKTQGEFWDIPIEIEAVQVKKDASLTFSNTVGTGNSEATIGTVVLEDGASFQNAAFKDDGTTLRLGYQLSVDNLSAKNATITTIDGTTTLGANNGLVQLSGILNESNEGRTILNLNSAEANWIVTGESKLAELNTKGGTTDISQTVDSVHVTDLAGTGTVIMDATGNNKLVVSNTAEGSSLIAKASKTADDVTIGEASSMVDRLEGVANKTGLVDEGMYQGAITVDGSGNASQSKNDLMADTLELTSASTLNLNRILMNDVRKRLGDIRSVGATNSVWTRYDGGKLSGDGTTNKFNTLHIGGDMTPFADNAVRMGVSASYTKGDVDYTRGSSDLDAYSLAAYGTWMADNGLFADVIARVAKSKSDMKVDGVYKGDLNNTAYSLSGEMGWRIDFNDMFYAEPQVEATYTYINSDKMTLKGNGEAYHYAIDSFDSLMGRVGVLAGMKCSAQKGDLYVRASMVHEFLGDATINGGNITKFENDGKDTWVEYGIGANFNVMKNAYIWADVERTAGANVEEDWRGTVGVRYAF